MNRQLAILIGAGALAGLRTSGDDCDAVSVTIETPPLTVIDDEPTIDLARTLPAKTPAAPRVLDARDHERIAAAEAKRARKAAKRQ